MDPRPRIALVLDSTGLHGAARHVHDLCAFLDAPDLQVHVVTLERAAELAVPIQGSNVPVHTLDLPDRFAPHALRWTIAGLLTLFNLFRKLRPTVVHTFGGRAEVLARTAARLARVPWVVSTLRRAERAHGVFGCLARATAPWVDVVVVPGAAMAAESAARYGVHRSRVRVIAPGIDLGAIAGEPPADFGSGRPLIGTMAWIDREAGLDTLLDAMVILRRYHPAARLLIAGSGPEGIATLRRAQRLGLEGAVLMPGPREDFGSCLAALDVCVLPARSAGAPQFLFEALAAGRPLVASRIPGVTDFVDDGEHALLVKPDHPALLADAIDRLLLDPSLAARLVTAGRSLVQSRHRAAPMAASIRDLYRSLCSPA